MNRLNFFLLSILAGRHRAMRLRRKLQTAPSSRCSALLLLCSPLCQEVALQTNIIVQIKPWSSLDGTHLSSVLQSRSKVPFQFSFAFLRGTLFSVIFLNESRGVFLFNSFIRFQHFIFNF